MGFPGLIGLPLGLIPWGGGLGGPPTPGLGLRTDGGGGGGLEPGFFPPIGMELTLGGALTTTSLLTLNSLTESSRSTALGT